MKASEYEYATLCIVSDIYVLLYVMLFFMLSYNPIYAPGAIRHAFSGSACILITAGLM
jgi:hypothetical protein